MKALFVGVILAGAASVPAWAQSEFYVEGAAGYVLGDEQGYGSSDFDTEDDWGFGGAAGVSGLLGPVDVELDVYVTERGYDGYDTSLKSLSVMVDGVYEIPAQLGPITPYVGGGLGMIQVEYDGADQFPAFSGDEWVFGWQAMAGGNLDLGAAGWSLFGEWRYQDASDAEIEGIDVGYSSHSVLVGARFTFGPAQ